MGWDEGRENEGRENMRDLRMINGGETRKM